MDMVSGQPDGMPPAWSTNGEGPNPNNNDSMGEDDKVNIEQIWNQDEEKWFFNTFHTTFLTAPFFRWNFCDIEY